MKRNIIIYYTEIEWLREPRSVVQMLKNGYDVVYLSYFRKLNIEPYLVKWNGY